MTTVRTKTNQAGSQLYLLNISTERQGGKVKEGDSQFELLKLGRSFVFHFFWRTFGEQKAAKISNIWPATRAFNVRLMFTRHLGGSSFRKLS